MVSPNPPQLGCTLNFHRVRLGQPLRCSVLASSLTYVIAKMTVKVRQIRFSNHFRTLAVITLACGLLCGHAVVPNTTPGQEPGYGDDYDDYDDGDMDDMDDGDEGYGGGYGDDYDDSGDDGGGYDMDMGGGGRSTAQLGPPSEAVQTYASSLVALMGDLNLSPLWKPAPNANVQAGPILKREAEEAFASGNVVGRSWKVTTGQTAIIASPARPGACWPSSRFWVSRSR